MDTPTELPQAAAPVIDCAAYSNGCRIADVAIDDIHQTLAHDDHSCGWGSTSPDEALLRRVQQQFDLHDLAVEDAYNAHQRPKLELYDNSLFIVLRTAQLTSPERTLEFGETHIFAGATTSSPSGTGRCGRISACVSAASRVRGSSPRGLATSSIP
jgi:magnesium transporter